jgi:hypothetical protein
MMVNGKKIIILGGDSCGQFEGTEEPHEIL